MSQKTQSEDSITQLIHGLYWNPTEPSKDLNILVVINIQLLVVD